MGIAPIDFAATMNTSADELGGASPLAANVLIDAAGVVTRRPGIELWNALPAIALDGSPIIGMTEYKGYLVWVCENRQIKSATPAGTYYALSDTTVATQLDGGLKPSFVRGRNILVIAGGGQMQKWTGSGLSARFAILDPTQPPPTAAHVSGIAQRLVVSRPNDSGQIWWSAPLEDYENWDMATSGAGFTQAAAKPDKIYAMFDNTNEVFSFGEDTIQVFDPSSTASVNGELLDFVPSRTMNLGVLGRDGIIPIDDMFMILDSNKRFVLTDARSYEDKSKEIIKTIRDMPTVDDCWGFRMRFGKHDALVFMFPTSGKGFVWEMSSGRWSEWSAWVTGPDNVSITAAYYWPSLGKVMVGLSDGRIGYLADSATGDLGNPIKAHVVSGFSDRGSSQQKWCKAIMLTFRREPGMTSDGFVKISTRDHLGSWKVRGTISLGEKLESTVILRSLGVYRQRQWKIEYTGTNPFALIKAQEDFDILGV